MKERNRSKVGSKIKIIASACCIAACIGLLFCYKSIGYAVIDSLVYYDGEMNFHYYSGLERPVTGAVYMISMIIVIIMLWIVLRQISDKKSLNILSYIKSCMLYITVLGMLAYQFFSLDISHIIVNDSGFYIIDNLLINSEFKGYSYDYFEDHVPVIQGDKVYFFRNGSGSDGISMEMERYIGMYSDKTEKLMAEIDSRTDNKYKLEQRLKEWQR